MKDSTNQESINERRQWLRRAMIAVPVGALGLSSLQNIKEAHAVNELILGSINSSPASDTGVNVPADNEFVITGDTSASMGLFEVLNTDPDGIAIYGWSTGSNGIGMYAIGTKASIVASGKLGVGTSSPTDMIHVIAPSLQDANIRFEGDGNVTGFVLKNTGTGGRDWRIRVNKNTITPNGGLVFQDDSASPPTPRMVITTSGNVGIGTTAPTQKLHVVGSVRATGGFITGDITFANGVIATEEGDGLAFINPQGKKIAILDSEGNFRIKGKVIEEN